MAVLAACGEFSIGIELPTQNNGTPVEGIPDQDSLSAAETAASMDVQEVETTTPPTVPAPEASPIPTESPPDPIGRQYWTVYQDPVYGFRFAAPCFWRVDFPTLHYEYATGGSYSAYNYTEEYVLSFPRSQIPAENGAIKLSFDAINLNSYGLVPGSSLAEFVEQENSDPRFSEVLLIEEFEVNGQPAVAATVHYLERDESSRYILVELSDEVFLRFSAWPSSKILNSPDGEGILNSITVDPAAEVILPAHTPSPPPIGLAAPCIPEYAAAVRPTIEIPQGNTVCGLSSFESLDYLTQTVQQYLQDRNTGSLRWEHYINDPFVIGYWGSEGISVEPGRVATELANSLYNAAEPGGMTFTTDQAAFPPLAGIPPESMFGPDVAVAQVVYSEGWGQDYLGAALLYFVQDKCGGYYWHGLVFSPVHFDK